jgi:hypothetical protein
VAEHQGGGGLADPALAADDGDRAAAPDRGLGPGHQLALGQLGRAGPEVDPPPGQPVDEAAPAVPGRGGLATQVALGGEVGGGGGRAAVGRRGHPGQPVGPVRPLGASVDQVAGVRRGWLAGGAAVAGRGRWLGPRWLGPGRPVGPVASAGRRGGCGGCGRRFGTPGRAGPLRCPTLGVGRRTRFVATAQRDQGFIGTPGPGRPLLLAHNDPRSVSRSRGSDAVRMRNWEDLSLCDYQQITLMCNDTKVIDQR